MNNKHFSDYIVYVDESGDHGLNNIDASYPVFVLAFCIFHKRYYSETVVPALENFKFKHFGHDIVVLHEHEIRKEKGDFNIFRSAAEREAFLDELSGVIADSHFILISCVIDKHLFRDRIGSNASNPYHYALRFGLEQLFNFLQEKSQQQLRTHVVVECRGKKEDRDLELEFRRICDGDNAFNHALPFQLKFADKRVNSAGLQLSDLVARPVGIHVLRPAQSNRAFEILCKKFYCEGGRDNAGTGYEGWGLKRLPDSPNEKSHTSKSEKPR